MKMPFWRGTKQTSQFEGTYDITLKMVDNSVAAEDGRDEYALSAFEDYVNAQHLTHMSCDSGWDRYLDWHLGLYVRRVSSVCSLDTTSRACLSLTRARARARFFAQ